jgi:hypothetical protein
MSASDSQPPALTNLRNYDPLARLRSDILPSQLERAEIARFRIDAQADASQVDRELVLCEDAIRKLERQAAQIQREASKFRQDALRLKRQKKQLNTLLELCDALSSPIRKLPADVLTEIFTYVAENDLTGTHKACTEFGDTTVPSQFMVMGYRLERVCSRWRRVALSTTALWSRISVPISPRHSIPVRQYGIPTVPILRTILRRSREHPLDLTVVYVDGDPWTNLLWDMLFDQRHRWQSLTIRMSDYTNQVSFGHFSNFLLSIPPFPLLERLEVCREFKWTEPLKACPRLRAYIGTDVNTPSEQIALPVVQISAVKLLHSFYGSQRLLGTFTSARAITVVLKDLPSSYSTVTLPKSCCSLTIEARHGLSKIPVANFTAPSTLSSLTLLAQRVDDTPRLFFSDLAKFLSESQCALTSLSFHWITLDCDEVPSLLAAAPSLITLSIKENMGHNGQPAERNCPMFHSETLRRFCDTTADGLGFILLPRLEHLELDIHTIDISDELIVDTIIPRALDNLRCFTLHMQDRLVNPHVYDRLADVVGPQFTARITGEATGMDQDWGGLSSYW